MVTEGVKRAGKGVGKGVVEVTKGAGKGVGKGVVEVTKGVVQLPGALNKAAHNPQQVVGAVADKVILNPGRQVSTVV